MCCLKNVLSLRSYYGKRALATQLLRKNVLSLRSYYGKTFKHFCIALTLCHFHLRNRLYLQLRFLHQQLAHQSLLFPQGYIGLLHRLQCYSTDLLFHLLPQYLFAW